MRGIKVGLMSAMIAGALASPVMAEGLTKDLFRARVLDVCLYDQWHRVKEKKGLLGQCKCAAKAFVKGLEKEELATALEKGNMTRPQKKDMLTALAKCRK